MTEINAQIALIGFMGSGKSTVAPLLAAVLGYACLDLDALLAERAGCSIPALFAREGEAGFRRRETALLREVSGRPRQVLATGGGVVLDPGNVVLLRADGLVVWLTVPLPLLLTRVGRGEGRPMLSGPDPGGTAARLWAEREPLYRRAADLVLDTSRLSPAQAAGLVGEWSKDFRREATL